MKEEIRVHPLFIATLGPSALRSLSPLPHPEMASILFSLQPRPGRFVSIRPGSADRLVSAFFPPRIPSALFTVRPFPSPAASPRPVG